ncbi:hypothetical protein [Pseudomonas sp. LF242]
MTSHEISNHNTSPLKPKGRNRLSITARLPAALGIRSVRPAHAQLLGVGVLMLLEVGWTRWCVKAW